MAKRKAAKSARGKARKGAKTTKKRAAGRRSPARRTAAKKTRVAAKKAKAPRAMKKAKAAPKKKATARKVARKSAPASRKAPSLDRARRTVLDDDIVPTPPSTLDLDRSASAVRSGRRSMVERLHEHNETSPALTAGDVDADWESAATVGDEAPGGDNPTPDQDIVDDIGKAVGVQYDDNEELKGEAKIANRDKHRWELDPASSEDYGDRDRKK